VSTEPRELTVATYNVYLGADLALLFAATGLEELDALAAAVRDQLARTDFRQRAAAIARILVRERVDVVGLQEVSRWTTSTLDGSGSAHGERVLEDFLPILLAALADAGANYDPHAVTPSFEGGLPVDGSWMGVAGANVVLVRRDGPFRLTDERTGTFADALELRTGIEGVSFPVVRSWGAVTGEVRGAPVLFVNTHTEAWDAGTRDAQRDELLAKVGDPGCPVVLVGDLNASPDAVGLVEPYVDAWLVSGGDPEAGLTCGQDAGLANVASALADRIDYVFVRDVSVRSCQVVGDQPGDRTDPDRLWPSDHAGVVARLAL
jgi:endonuclease/exonuclease/phosphatase family metal-dependent hydrolase